jgi:hypothetical protein
MLSGFNLESLSLNVAKDMEVMRNRLSRCTLLCITVTVLGLLSTGCKTSSWSSWSWPGTSWWTGAKATSSEYPVPDKPSSNYSSLPVDQAEKYTEPQTTQGTGDGRPSYLLGTAGPLNNYPSTNQGNSNYLSPPPAAQQPVDPYVSPPINQLQQGPYNSNLYDGTRGSTLLPPTATPVTAGDFQAPALDQAPPAATRLNTDDSNYNQGFYKPGAGQFNTPATQQQDIDAFPIDQGSSGTLDPVYTGQLPPATTGTQLDVLPATAVPASLPAIPPAGSYRPGSTGVGN